MTALTAPPSTAVGARVRAGQIVLTVVLVIAGVIGVSTLFTADDPFPPAANVLVASFASLAAVFGFVAVWGGLGSRAVRIGLVALPLFFVWHVAALGTWIPDAAFAVIAGVGVALVQAAPRR